MATIKVEIEGIDRINKRLAAMQNTARITQAVNEATAVVITNIDNLTPIRSENLRRKNHVVPARNEGSEIVGAVENNCEYAAYVEFGTGVMGQATHNAPKDKTLDFGTQRGQRAQSFMYRGLNNSKSQVGRVFERRLSGITKG